MLKGFTILCCVLICQLSYAQNVAINATGAAPDASAGLDISSTTKGLLAPRMTSTQKNAILNPATGLLVFQTDAPAGFYYNSGTPGSPVWVYNGSGSQWNTSGNNIYYTGGNVAIGTSSNPTYALTVNAATNPLFLSGVQQGSGLDSILIIANGIVKKRVYSATASSDSWSLTGNAGQAAASATTGSFIGTKDANPLRFRTNDIQRMYIHESNGGVAIGANPIFNTTNPERLLVDIGGTAGTPAATTNFNAIKATGFINNYLQLNVQNKHAGAASTSDIVATANNGTETNYYVDMGINSSAYNPATPFFGGFRDAYLYTLGEDLLIGAGTAGKNLKFLTGGTSESANTRMIIDGDGAVGIGTTTTSTGKVSVNAGSGLSTSTTAMYLTGGNNGVLQLNIQNMGAGDGTAVSSDIVATASNGTDSTNYINMGINGGDNEDDSTSILSGPNKAYFYANSKNMYIGNAGKDFSLIFFTNSGSVSDIDANGAERMRITSTGQVTIGTATPNGSNKLTVNGAIIATNIYQNSDRRLKRNIRPLDYGLKDILRLEPVKYNWIDKSQTTQKQLGLIAQDTKKIIPEMVTGDETKDMLGINYTQAIPVMINAIKEQQQQIDDLKKRSEKNKAQIEAILKDLKTD